MKWTVLLPSIVVVLPLSLSTPARAENLEHTQQLLQTRSCQQCDLSNAGLVFANLSKANLQGADLSNANLSRANLSQADLTGANLTGASLFGANLTGAKLNGTQFVGADLRNAYLGNAQVVGINLMNANMQGVVGLPTQVGHARDFFNWAIAASDAKLYGRAVENYSQAIAIDPEMGAAYLGRGMAMFQIGDRKGALVDAKQAAAVFEAKSDEEGLKAATAFAQLIETPEKDPLGGSKIGNAFMSILSGGLSLLRMFPLF
jgi:uncharacterized protein YjbI with pentapeptide repeats